MSNGASWGNGESWGDARQVFIQRKVEAEKRDNRFVFHHSPHGGYKSSGKTSCHDHGKGSAKSFTEHGLGSTDDTIGARDRKTKATPHEPKLRCTCGDTNINIMLCDHSLVLFHLFSIERVKFEGVGKERTSEEVK